MPFSCTWSTSFTASHIDVIGVMRARTAAGSSGSSPAWRNSGRRSAMKVIAALV
jgi:hypothetical protein